MKLAYFSPLSPQRSGISDYSEELLPYLSPAAAITLFVDGFEPTNPEVISRFEILDYRKHPDVLKQLESHDAILYHMGNDHRYHTGIFETMVKYPGILVLHDFALHDFFFNLARTQKDLRLYLDEVGLCYGETIKQAASDALKAGATPRIATHPVKFPLNDRIVRTAKGVIVHSNWSRQRVLSIAPGALIETIPHHITERAATAEPAARANGGGPVRIASFGLINPHKGIDRALRALSALRERYDFTYTLVGDPNRYFDVRSLIHEYGLEDRVAITGHVDLTDFQRHISETDIAINLRESIIGETSGSLCRIMAAAVPAIVADAGWFGELPNNAVVKVNMHHQTDELLQAYLEALIVDEELRKEIGANARRHVLADNDIRKSAAHYLEFISRVVAERSEEYVVDAFAREIGILGIDASASDQVLAQVAADIAPLVRSSVNVKPEKESVASRPSSSAQSVRSNGHENGRLRKLAGVDYRQAAIDYVSKLDPERRHHLYTKPFYNLAHKPEKYAGEGLDVDAFRHFCDFANIAVALALPAGSTILDVGCGSGWLSEYFARLGYVVKGIDISPELIEMSRERVARTPYPVDPETTMRCDFEVHDIERAPLHKQFDCVICYDSLHHFEDERAVIAHLAGATRYGGSLFILEGDRPAGGSASEAELIGVMRKFGTLESPFSREYLRTLLDENGFAVVGDYVSVNGLFERESVHGDLLRVNPPAVNYLLCKKVVREAGAPASTAPDSRQPSILRAEFTILEAPPERIAPGELLSFRIAIENSGDTLWLASATPRAGIVMPAIRVFDAAGSLVTEFHGEPLLPHAVAPGETVRVKIEYRAPQRRGTYRLKVDLVDQQVAWFEQRGSEALVVQFEVRDS